MSDWNCFVRVASIRLLGDVHTEIRKGECKRHRIPIPKKIYYLSYSSICIQTYSRQLNRQNSYTLFFNYSRYNGFLPQGDRGRRRSKFVLYKRTESNGVKRSNHYIVQSPENTKAILDAQQHSISYTLSRNQAVIVEYKEDAETDMFQVSYI